MDKGKKDMNITFQGGRRIEKKRQINKGTEGKKGGEESTKTGTRREGNHFTVHLNMIPVTT